MNSMMKKILLLCLVGLYCMNAFSQNFLKVKEAKEIVWYGIDFTQAKMIGTQAIDFTNPEQIVNHYFEAWNGLVLSEPKKYNIELAIRKDIEYRIEAANNFNIQVSPDSLVSTKRNNLSDDDLITIVAKYIGKEEGVGLLFAVENFEKALATARVHVVFFDISTGNILHSQFFTPSVGGFGFRNYWASAFYNTLKRVKNEYPKWYKSTK